MDKKAWLVGTSSALAAQRQQNLRTAACQEHCESDALARQLAKANAEIERLRMQLDARPPPSAAALPPPLAEGRKASPRKELLIGGGMPVAARAQIPPDMPQARPAVELESTSTNGGPLPDARQMMEMILSQQEAMSKLQLAVDALSGQMFGVLQHSLRIDPQLESLRDAISAGSGASPARSEPDRAAVQGWAEGQKPLAAGSEERQKPDGAKECVPRRRSSIGGRTRYQGTQQTGNEARMRNLHPDLLTTCAGSEAEPVGNKEAPPRAWSFDDGGETLSSLYGYAIVVILGSSDQGGWGSLATACEALGLLLLLLFFQILFTCKHPARLSRRRNQPSA